MNYRIVAIPGDGIGPEVVREAILILNCFISYGLTIPIQYIQETYVKPPQLPTIMHKNN